MANVLIVAYLLIVLALIAVILLQRSEGGGLGMGSSSTGLISVRGSANLLTRTTAILAALFFASAIGLTILTELERGGSSILDRASEGGAAPTTVLDAIQQMQQQTGADLPVPATDGTTTAPATVDGAATTAPATGSDLPVPTETAPATTEQPAAPAN
jgi:preprotein translocase subunit SecG